MGDISQKRKHYTLIDHEVMIDLPPALSFELDHHIWNFDELATWGKRENLAYHFSVVFWQRRHEVTHTTKLNYWHSYKVFWKFLDIIYPELTKAEELTTEVIQSFIVWLNYTKLALGRWNKEAGEPTSQGTQHKMYSLIKGVILRLISSNVISQDIDFPVIAFQNLEYNTNKTAPYSRTERQRIVTACKNEIIEIKENNLHENRLGMLIPYMLLIALRTGIHGQPLLDLHINSLKDSILDGRMILSIYKNRGYSSQNIDVSELGTGDIHITKRVAGLIKEVQALTGGLRLNASEELSQDLWLIRDKYDSTKVLSVKSTSSVYTAIQAFAISHDLRSDQGEQLNLNLRRMRPTFAHALLRINGGDLRDLQKRLNHKNIATTMGYLDPEQDEFKSSFKHQGLVMQYWVKGVHDVTSEEMAKKLNITIDEAKKVISGANDMLVGSCKNPLDSSFNKNSEGACTNFMACFRCPNQIIMKDDLHKVFSFYWYLLRKKAMIPDKAWEKAYAWIIRIIDEDIVPQIDPEIDIDALKENAKNNPHPAWPNMELSINELGSNLS